MNATSGNTVKGFDAPPLTSISKSVKVENLAGKSDDLVERVIESMKVLNRKEEEIKQQAKLITDKQQIKKPTVI